MDERKYVLSIFIDLTKPFDTVNHEILLNKLEYYGIRGHANDFFKSYLSNRRQYTVVNGIKSKLKCVPCGVPQGSLLGLLFFLLLYINDIYRAVGENGIWLFADDTSLSACSLDLDELNRNAKIAFEKLYSWCTCKKLTINNDKTYFILLHMKNKPVPRNFSALHTDVMNIDKVEATKYLGVTLDEKWTWQEQISSVCSSLLQFFWIFNHIKLFVSRKIARQIYFACVYSRIRYAIKISGSCSKQLISRMQIMQNKLLKLLFNFDRYTNTIFLHKELSLLKVEDIYTTNLLSFVNECRARRSAPVSHDYFSVHESQYEVRNVGRLNVPRARTEMGF